MDTFYYRKFKNFCSSENSNRAKTQGYKLGETICYTYITNKGLLSSIELQRTIKNKDN